MILSQNSALSLAGDLGTETPRVFKQAKEVMSDLRVRTDTAGGWGVGTVFLRSEIHQAGRV